MNRRGPKQIDLMRVPEYRKIVTSKHNGKVLENGNVRVGDDMVWNRKTGMISKFVGILLLFCTLSYGQLEQDSNNNLSYQDSSIGVGIGEGVLATGTIELRYNKQIVDGFYISASGNFQLAINTSNNYNMYIFPRIALTDAISNGVQLSVGTSLENKTRLYTRCDIKVYEDDRGAIGGMIDIQRDRAMVGIVFKHYNDRARF